MSAIIATTAGYNNGPIPRTKPITPDELRLRDEFNVQFPMLDVIIDDVAGVPAVSVCFHNAVRHAVRGRARNVAASDLAECFWHWANGALLVNPEDDYHKKARRAGIESWANAAPENAAWLGAAP